MYLNGRLLFSAIVTSLYLFHCTNGIRTKDKMYQKIEASNTCFRKLNATHQVGCSSEWGGSTGVIHYCETQEELDFILKNGTAPPYVPVLPTDLFNNENLSKLKRSKKISGLLLYVSEKPVNAWSHDDECPNRESSLKGTCKASRVWNPSGTGILYQDIPFPIFFVENYGKVEFAKDCFQKHNNFSFNTQRDRSLCSLQLVSFMFATTNSPMCIRRSNSVSNLNPVKFCDPLGDKNVWSTLFPLVKAPNYIEPIRDFSYIIVAARLDTTSMFDKTVGAISPVTGLVTLLATAKYLKTILPENRNFTKNVLFLLFNGESYDYIGSQRFVYELLKGNFPSKLNDTLPTITIDDIDLYIELSQLSNSNITVAHYLKDNVPKDFILKMRSYKDNLNFDVAEDSLPPASLHSFLKNKTKLPSLILADHSGSYVNPFYNSVYDNATNLKYSYLNLSGTDIVESNSIQAHIQKVSSMVAKSIYHEITGKSLYSQSDDLADIQFIDELFHCYLESSQCRVHQAIQTLKLQQNVPQSLYVGVEDSYNFITTLIGLTLGWVTGNITGEGNINCTNEGKGYGVRYYNMSYNLDDLNTTKCFRTTMNFTDAVSPAFIIDDYDWSSGEYSTWAESTWGEFQLRIFLKPSAAHENMTIAIGSMVFIFSLLFVYFVKSRSHILFSPELPTLAPTNC